MPIEVYCLACGHKYRLADSFAGKTVKCKQCHALIHVPDSTPAEPSPFPTLPALDPLPPLQPYIPDLCPNCHAIIEPGTVICTNCGLNFRTGEVITTTKATKSTNARITIPIGHRSLLPNTGHIDSHRHSAARIAFWLGVLSSIPAAYGYCAFVCITSWLARNQIPVPTLAFLYWVLLAHGGIALAYFIGGPAVRRGSTFWTLALLCIGSLQELSIISAIVQLVQKTQSDPDATSWCLIIFFGMLSLAIANMIIRFAIVLSSADS